MFPSCFVLVSFSGSTLLNLVSEHSIDSIYSLHSFVCLYSVRWTRKACIMLFMSLLARTHQMLWCEGGSRWVTNLGEREGTLQVNRLIEEHIVLSNSFEDTLGAPQSSPRFHAISHLLLFHILTLIYWALSNMQFILNMCLICYFNCPQILWSNLFSVSNINKKIK